MEFESYIKEHFEIKPTEIHDVYLSGIKIATLVGSYKESRLLKFLHQHLITSLIHCCGETDGKMIYVGFSQKEQVYFVWTNKSSFYGTDYISDIHNNKTTIDEIAAFYFKTLINFRNIIPVAFESKNLDHAKDVALKFGDKLLTLKNI